MPCCTLLAFFLSQLGIATGAARLHLLSGGAARFAQMGSAYWRKVGLLGMVALEIMLAGAAAPYLITSAGRAEAAQSFAGAWHLCHMEWRAVSLIGK